MSVARACLSRRLTMPVANLSPLAEKGYVFLKNAIPCTSMSSMEVHRAVDVWRDSFEDCALRAWRKAGFDYSVGDYEGGSLPRMLVGSSAGSGSPVYNVTAGSMPHQTVQPHAEVAYLNWMPHFAAFGCLKPAASGGEMTLTDMRVAQELLSPELRSRLTQVGVTYKRHMGDSIQSKDWPYQTGHWQERFQTSSWEEATAQVAANPYYGKNCTLEFEAKSKTAVLTWTVSGDVSRPLSNGSRGSPIVATSILIHHRLNDLMGDVSFYQDGKARPPPKHCTWGDGTEISESELRELHAAYKDPDATQALMLQPGDVLVVDNFQYAHGRLPFQGQREHIALFSEKIPRL